MVLLNIIVTLTATAIIEGLREVLQTHLSRRLAWETLSLSYIALVLFKYEAINEGLLKDNRGDLIIEVRIARLWSNLFSLLLFNRENKKHAMKRYMVSLERSKLKNEKLLERRNTSEQV